MKVGFVGCGGFSTGTHIPNVAKNPGLEIRAFCDLNTALIQKLKDEYLEIVLLQNHIFLTQISQFGANIWTIVSQKINLKTNI